MSSFLFRRAVPSLVGVIAVAIMASVSLAGPLVASGDYSGYRQTEGTSGSGGGLTWNPDDGGWSQGGFKIEWEIEQHGQLFEYSYTITAPKKDVSHWILQLTEGVDWSNATFDSDVNAQVTIETFNGQGGSNPGMPGPIYGVKFDYEDQQTATFWFSTEQAPVWGDFYSKDGVDGGEFVYVYNTGFGSDPTSDGAFGYLNWIARPNGDTHAVIPEPMSVAVWSLLMGSVGLVALRRRRVR